MTFLDLLHLQTPTGTNIHVWDFCAEGKASKGKGKPRKHAELFSIASASEVVVAPGVSGWRVALGNIAAGGHCRGHCRSRSALA